MAKQISKNKAMLSVFQLKTSQSCFKIFIVGLWVLSALISLVQTSICASSVPSSAATTKELCTLAFEFDF